MKNKKYEQWINKLEKGRKVEDKKKIERQI